MASKSSKSQEGYYSAYKSSNRWKTNRERRLLKLLKTQPNNKDIPEALANLKYRRRKPTSRMWSKSNIRLAKLLKQFTGSCPHAVFSSNPKIAEPAMAALRRTHDPKSLPQGKVSFKLGDRVFARNAN